jgi:hypothetical protein
MSGLLTTCCSASVFTPGLCILTALITGLWRHIIDTLAVNCE